MEKVTAHALTLARERRHEFTTVEHLLLALLDDREVSTILRSIGADVSEIGEELTKYIDNDCGGMGHTDGEIRTGFSLGFQRVVRRAANYSHGSISSSHVLAAVFSESECHAAYILDRHEVQRSDVLEYLSHPTKPTKLRKSEPGRRLAVAGRKDTEEEADGDSAGEDDIDPRSPLRQFCVDLNALARADKIDPLVGRESEVDRCARVLCRRRKNNPLLVGEPGVGKTAIAEGLARMIVTEEAPLPLRDATIYALNIGAMVGGTRYRGDFEERLTELINQLSDRDDAILFIDELHMVVGAGETGGGGAVDASNMLKPALQSGRIRCIGATTHQDFRRYCERDRALLRRFQRIDIEEPSRDDSVKILEGLRPGLERHHGVRFTREALTSAVDLSARFIHERKLPDKAIDLIDEAGASVQLLPDSRRRKMITHRDIEKVVAEVAGVPPKTVSNEDSEVLHQLEERLQAVVFGQDQAIAALCTAVKLSRAGLREPERPVGSFLFTGPTGVGKTEVARQLAEVLSAKLVRFDMSEYRDRFTSSRLIGAPPGYVGYQEGGLLTDAIDKHPRSVVLLDEIEKAHPSILNLLLQVMDHGKLSDHGGRQMDFRQAVLVMTSNAGAAEREQRTIGFDSEQNDAGAEAEVKRFFTPEFRNRLDSIITFAPLSREVMLRVVHKFIAQLEAQLSEREVSIELSAAAASRLSELGYSATMGARPLSRVINDRIKQPLSEELLFGELKNGGTVHIDVRDDEFVFEYERNAGGGRYLPAARVRSLPPSKK